MSRFKNKVAVITGSNRGIGKATAMELASRGVKIVLFGRNEDRLEHTKQEMLARGDDVISVRGDVTSIADCQRLIRSAVDRFGKIDILVNNAGMSSRGNIEETDPEVFRSMMDINFFGQLNTIQPALPHIRQTKGSIVLVSSLAGIKGLPGSSAYCASKMALTALAESLKIELAGSGIHIGLILMGIVMNEPDKTAINKDGKPILLADRSSRRVLSIQKASRLIVRNIEKRKFKSVTTRLGKIHAFSNKFLPGLEDFVLIKAKKTVEKMNK